MFEVSPLMRANQFWALFDYALFEQVGRTAYGNKNVMLMIFKKGLTQGPTNNMLIGRHREGTSKARYWVLL